MKFVPIILAAAMPTVQAIAVDVDPAELLDETVSIQEDATSIEEMPSLITPDLYQADNDLPVEGYSGVDGPTQHLDRRGTHGLMDILCPGDTVKNTLVCRPQADGRVPKLSEPMPCDGKKLTGEQCLELCMDRGAVGEKIRCKEWSKCDSMTFNNHCLCLWACPAKDNKHPDGFVGARGKIPVPLDAVNEVKSAWSRAGIEPSFRGLPEQT